MRLRPCAIALLAAVAAQGPAAAPVRADQFDDPLAYLAWQFGDDAAMGMRSGWQLATGGPVTVAVIDTGVDLAHPDLQGNLWTNPGEIPGNGVDDDHDGFVDDVHGADLVARNGDPQDRNGHGTHVAGIIGALGGNGIGSAGVDWHARLMVVRVLDARGEGSPARIARGVMYALARGARILNLSLGARLPDRRLLAALRAARAKGALVVTSAGNDGADLRRVPNYPAAYRLPNVLAVAATRQDGSLDPVSDYGSGVALAAPGADIVSTALGGGYQLRSGTSMAAAFVSGAAALVAAAHPAYRWPQVVRALRAGARRDGRARGLPVLDVGGALRAADAEDSGYPPKS